LKWGGLKKVGIKIRPAIQSRQNVLLKNHYS